MRKFCLVKSLIFKTVCKGPVRGLYGNREFNLSLWSMIYLALKSRFNAIVSFRNGILVSLASKSRTRTER